MSSPNSKHQGPYSAAGKTRTPNGVERPVALRLMPEERAKVEQYSEANAVSMASFARQMFLQGLAQFERGARHPFQIGG